MSSGSDVDTEAKEIAKKLLDEHDQSETFINRFINFYGNITENNYTESSVERLIESVELSEEDRIDES